MKPKAKFLSNPGFLWFTIVLSVLVQKEKCSLQASNILLTKQNFNYRVDVNAGIYKNVLIEDGLKAETTMEVIMI